MFPPRRDIWASAAFPPFLSLVVLKLNAADFDPSTKGDLQFKPYTSEEVLTDGGVYDNLGLETAWKPYEPILVSDGAGGSSDEPKPKREWLEHVYWVLNLLTLRCVAFANVRLSVHISSIFVRGTYWGIRTNVADYKLPTAEAIYRNSK